MSILFRTRHAQQRQTQRSFRYSSFETIFQLGTNLSDQEIVMTRKDIQNRISELKKEIQSLDKLKNRKIVVDRDTLITACCMRRRAKYKRQN